jgi:hypothetical protein
MIVKAKFADLSTKEKLQALKFLLESEGINYDAFVRESYKTESYLVPQRKGLDPYTWLEICIEKSVSLYGIINGMAIWPAVAHNLGIKLSCIRNAAYKANGYDYKRQYKLYEEQLDISSIFRI